ncbi:aspartate/glutamate racemase family protein [Psychrobacter sp. AOP22-C1-22]|uniref:aspartate/glutamate racemase family protein n=1 Tax=unclassified Psychrobacter TaxID=196806 RepID=UPI001787A87F|nr:MULTISPECIES: aspartate/glutamate racemase family protein [unclassified Psychrobacter]MDN5802117.1 aspartate/glutamate racemase family protein [Psychrobacter sp.]MBE0406714.1 aspartate/glutamate racemase family protein [Psychrobacter sp. FME6]MBE0446189.1 aspartate/glutamate racemase family protein [Psychrobacter sp. FME5]MDN5890588.1 aspartate/glutamate racemase family protein [Psychrobacter sp.]MDN5897383.1 aspartate/glutamate racemase family protein [Psychrobacter sp.]
MSTEQRNAKQKILGIIGGMSWESTESYYRLINEGIKSELGNLHSADLLIHSVDFAPIGELQAQGAWEEMGEILANSGKRLQAAGAQGLLIATNTMHKVVDEVQAATGLPIIHIADATAKAIKNKGLTRVALLGTQFTMTQDFYKQRLIDAGLQVFIPDADAREEVHRVIYDELCQGQLLDSSRQYYRQVIEDLAEQGCEGVILGCTEIGLLIKQADSPIPVFDTTAIHAAAAVDFLLGNANF